jgi:hypothetical protein
VSTLFPEMGFAVAKNRSRQKYDAVLNGVISVIWISKTPKITGLI